MVYDGSFPTESYTLGPGPLTVDTITHAPHTGILAHFYCVNERCGRVKHCGPYAECPSCGRDGVEHAS